MISLPGMLWGCIGSLDLLMYEEMKSLTRGSRALNLVEPELAVGVSRQDVRRTIRHCLINQHWVWWRGLGNTQRHAQELISEPCLGAMARFLSKMSHPRCVYINNRCGYQSITQQYLKRCLIKDE